MGSDSPLTIKSLVPNNHVEDSKGRAANLWFHLKGTLMGTFVLQYTKEYEDYDNYDRYDSSFELQRLTTYNSQNLRYRDAQEA